MMLWYLFLSVGFDIVTFQQFGYWVLVAIALELLGLYLLANILFDA